jgi:hypothetical protein
VKRPQFKSFLANRSKGQLVDCLHSAWRLRSAPVKKIKTITTLPSSTQILLCGMRKTILAACGDSVEESFENDYNDAQSQFDLVPVLRAKSEKTRREEGMCRFAYL